MKHRYILALALALTSQANAADKDSVYTWGAWTQNIQPAAGPALRVAPAPVIPPEVNFRPNENSAFNRAAQAPVITPTPSVVTPPITIPALPIVPNQPQLPEIVSAPVDAPVIDASNLPATTAFSLKSVR